MIKIKDGILRVRGDITTVMADFSTICYHFWKVHGEEMTMLAIKKGIQLAEEEEGEKQ